MTSELVKALESIVGAEHVRTDGEARRYAVDGVIPATAIFPGSVEEVSAVLAACSRQQAAVIPWGGGTSMGLGGLPKKVDVVMGLERLNRVIEHEPGDMTSTVEAGMVIGEYQVALGRHGQFLGLDPPCGERATIGGILAANTSGPRRIRYGTARDLLIGVRVAHADGTVTKGGAKVVKNVTGYDMNKLYIGSLGTLGVIVEATFRLYPIPAEERTWVASFPTAAKASEAVAVILDSPLVPSAVELLNGTAAVEVGGKSGVLSESNGALLAMAVASVPEAVEAQLRTAREIGSKAGGGDGRVLGGEIHQKFWAAVRDFDAGAGAMVLKASVLLTKVANAMDLGERLAAQHGLRVGVLSEAGTGIVRYHVSANDGGADRFARLAGVVTTLRAFTAEAKGSLVVLEAPPEVKRAVDVWGPAGNGFALMQGLKAEFDPNRILNPGRFVGGL
jgi:glycolate oxidase FAD binding subunit